jgi:hypothetical protein
MTPKKCADHLWLLFFFTFCQSQIFIYIVGLDVSVRLSISFSIVCPFVIFYLSLSICLFVWISLFSPFARAFNLDDEYLQNCIFLKSLLCLSFGLNFFLFVYSYLWVTKLTPLYCSFFSVFGVGILFLLFDIAYIFLFSLNVFVGMIVIGLRHKFQFFISWMQTAPLERSFAMRHYPVQKINELKRKELNRPNSFGTKSYFLL